MLAGGQLDVQRRRAGRPEVDPDRRAGDVGVDVERDQLAIGDGVDLGVLGPYRGGDIGRAAECAELTGRGQRGIDLAFAIGAQEQVGPGARQLGHRAAGGLAGGRDRDRLARGGHDLAARQRAECALGRGHRRRQGHRVAVGVAPGERVLDAVTDHRIEARGGDGDPQLLRGIAAISARAGGAAARPGARPIAQIDHRDALARGRRRGHWPGRDG